MPEEAWQDIEQPWSEAIRWFFMSYLQALAADGDGLPNWFWPTVLLASVTTIAMGGFMLLVAVFIMSPVWARPGALLVLLDYCRFVLPWYAGFVAVDITVWLTFRGWGKHMTRKAQIAAATPAPPAAPAVTTRTEVKTEQVTTPAPVAPVAPVEEDSSNESIRQ